MTYERWLADRHKERLAAGLHRRLKPRGAAEAILDLAGNDYLGLRRDERLAVAAASAAHAWGVGAGSSRLVSGTTTLHRDVETGLAAFTGRPDALTFSTGYHANLAVVSALSDRDTLIVSDAHLHASLVDACRLAHRSRLAIVPHNDVCAVADALADRTEARAMVLTESVYSVLGDAAPLAELACLTARYDALLVVDEAHALGVAGPGGRGLVAAAGLASSPEVVVTGTLSKAFGSQGGLVLASAAVVDHLVNTARPFIYDTGLAPPSAAAALAALDVIAAGSGLPERACHTARGVAGCLGLPPPAGSVLSVSAGAPAAALRAQDELAALGFGVGCFRPPSVPDGVSRLRFAIPATVPPTRVDAFVAAVAAVLPDRRLTGHGVCHGPGRSPSHSPGPDGGPSHTPNPRAEG